MQAILHPSLVDEIKGFLYKRISINLFRLCCWRRILGLLCFFFLSAVQLPVVVKRLRQPELPLGPISRLSLGQVLYRISRDTAQYLSIFSVKIPYCDGPILSGCKDSGGIPVLDVNRQSFHLGGCSISGDSTGCSHNSCSYGDQFLFHLRKPPFATKDTSTVPRKLSPKLPKL